MSRSSPACAETSREDIRIDRGVTRRALRVRVLIGLLLSVLVAIFGTALMVLVSCATLFQSRRWNTAFLAKWMARIVLRLCGIRMQVDRSGHWPTEQTVYISNHTSLLDLFVIIALGIPRTRYFLSGFLRAIPFFAVCGYLMGIFWTARQHYPQRRRALFQRAEDVLRRTGDSVFLTPEGQQIGVFNKGAFHLATNLRAPIQPIYIHIPDDVDPGPWSDNKRLDVRPGVINVVFKQTIDTSDWQLSELEENRDRVRSLYAQWTREFRGRLPQLYSS